jgi:hypothetical protein
LALVAANAPVANSNANPSTKLFDIVTNFMIAPFSPRIASGIGWAARLTTFARKLLGVCRESPTIQPSGFSGKADKPDRCAWGFSHLGRQTENERTPRPRKIYRALLRYCFCRAYDCAHQILRRPSFESSISSEITLHFLGRSENISGSNRVNFSRALQRFVVLLSLTKVCRNQISAE